MPGWDNAAKARTWLTDNPAPDVILLDIRMPGMSGVVFLKELAGLAAGVPVIVITNQAGIARGHFTLEALLGIHERMARELTERGAMVDGIYFCPHAPDAGCDCRKPALGNFQRAAREHDLDLARSAMIGDRESDVRAAQAMGGLGVLVRTGYGQTEVARLHEWDGHQPAFIADDLAEAVAWWLTKRET